MPYVSLDNLARFHGRLRDRASSEFASLDMANWQRTAAAGAVSFLPVPEMPLDPVVNFAFTETGPASGTKGPDNPSTITGVTQAKVTRCGKNICPPKPYTSITYRGVTFEYDPSDGGIFIQGTADADKNPLIDFIAVAYGNNPAPFVRGKTYSFYLACSDSNVSMQLYDKTADTISGNPEESGTQFVHTIKSDSRSILFRLSVARGAAVNTKAYVQIEEGSAATSFEPYSGADYTISLNGTYYGGSVDLSAGTMTVTHVKETIASVAGGGVFESVVVFNAWPSATIVSGESATVCEELPYAAGNVESEHWRNLTSSSGTVGCYVYLLKSRFDVSGAVDPSNPTTAEWRAAANAYLAANPLHFVFTLATPYTVQLNPTQIYSLSQSDSYVPRTNTVYSDQISVQVGYPKSPQATQNELTNAVVSLGGNV